MKNKLMKLFLFSSFILFCVTITGCAATYNLTKEQQTEALRKYEPSFLNLKPDNSIAMISTKVFLRVLCGSLTFGLSEAALTDEREKSYYHYSKYLFYNSLLGKSKSTVLQELGAPNRTFLDEQGGEIYTYERNFTTGGEYHYYYYSHGNAYYGGGHGYGYTTPIQHHKDVKEFYFDPKGICFKWRTKIE